MERIMSLTQKSRTEIYRALSELGADPDAVEELLSHFPSRDLDEPVTKEFHRAESATLRTEMADLRTELRIEMAEGAAQLRAEMADLRTELRIEMAEGAAQLRAEMAELRTEMHVGFADMRTEMHQGFQRMTLSLAALMVSMTGVTVAALTIAR
jgi:1,6-anhydro-N-acetylmuramate kinase